MRKILVTGANGMLGTDLCRIFQKNGQVIKTDIEEMDVRDHKLVYETISNLHPDYVIHLAALTNVDECEQVPDEAYLTNTIGTHNVVLACQAIDIPMVYVSTISVFNGDKFEPYNEFDTPDPKSWYSRSKHQGELIVEKLLSKYFIVRAGWMFGGGNEDKKFVAKILELAQSRDELNIVDDKFGSPTYTIDFANAIEKLINTKLFGTYHMVNTGGYCSRYQFAKAILELAEITKCKLISVNSAEFPLPAPRPRMEAAKNYQLELRGFDWMPTWREALARYIKNTFLL